MLVNNWPNNDYLQLFVIINCVSELFLIISSWFKYIILNSWDTIDNYKYSLSSYSQRPVTSKHRITAEPLAFKGNTSVL